MTGTRSGFEAGLWASMGFRGPSGREKGRTYRRTCDLLLDVDEQVTLVAGFGIDINIPARQGIVLLVEEEDGFQAVLPFRVRTGIAVMLVFADLGMLHCDAQRRGGVPRLATAK